ncbi:MAG: hypothetical protein PHY42_03955 [Bacilli bacterium]|nr:hypothetical protein [Bacilli bacterium]
MNSTIKFPKEVTYLKNSIRQASSFSAIIRLKDDILEHAKVLEPIEVAELLKAYFYSRGYEMVILVGDELQKRGCSSLVYDYYILASYLALGESFQARNYLKRSPALSAQDIKILYQEGGANYSTIHGWSHRSYNQVVLTVVLAAFVVEYTDDHLDEDIDPMVYLVMRMIDLLNILIEIGYEKEHINTLKKTIEIMFTIKL